MTLLTFTYIIKKCKSSFSSWVQFNFVLRWKDKRSKKFAQKQSGYLSFLLIYTSFTLLAYQWPLFSVVFDTLNFTSGNNWINILAVLVIQICLILFLLSILSLFGTFILKIVSTLLLITNSAALYFMIEYNIEIDRSMIENILNTNLSFSSPEP